MVLQWLWNIFGYFSSSPSPPAPLKTRSGASGKVVSGTTRTKDRHVSVELTINRQGSRINVLARKKKSTNYLRKPVTTDKTKCRPKQPTTDKTRQDEHKRPPIPKSIRTKVWIKYCGDKDTGSCYACGKKVTRKNKGWHCSHVKAWSLGGKDEVSNLRVCCPTCNLSMGTKNMYRYIAENKLKGPGSKRETS